MADGASLYRRAENVEWTQQCWSWHHRKLSFTMLWTTHLAGEIGLAALVAICTGFRVAVHTGFSSTADGTQKKPRAKGYVYQCKHSRRGKEKGVVLLKKLRQLIVTCHHDMPVPLHHSKVLFKINLSHSVGLCFVVSGKVLLFFSLAKI